ncbi:hypothetical protein AB0D14_18820 [Streptomyces sp. NPDC048484]|uniref:hypothetical protein n=1 Tax=Streptomyces sp. NPDC048484 TaxID=3155146 RepID=UPI003431BB4D
MIRAGSVKNIIPPDEPARGAPGNGWDGTLVWHRLATDVIQRLGHDVLLVTVAR